MEDDDIIARIKSSENELKILTEKLLSKTSVICAANQPEIQSKPPNQHSNEITKSYNPEFLPASNESLRISSLVESRSCDDNEVHALEQLLLQEEADTVAEKQEKMQVVSLLRTVNTKNETLEAENHFLKAEIERLRSEECEKLIEQEQECYTEMRTACETFTSVTEKHTHNIRMLAEFVEKCAERLEEVETSVQEVESTIRRQYRGWLQLITEYETRSFTRFENDVQ